jgi:predicted transcriptional regulator of viral defense system
VFITSTSFQRNQIILGTEFQFIQCKPEHFFGIADEWVDKSELVRVSDIEKTVLDGLQHPRYCGGLSEVAKGLWMKHGELNVARLVAYALRLKVGAVVRRLGFLLELYQIAAPQELNLLQSQLTASYDLLDPTLPREGKKIASWRLLVNISSEELLALRAS